MKPALLPTLALALGCARSPEPTPAAPDSPPGGPAPSTAQAPAATPASPAPAADPPATLALNASTSSVTGCLASESGTEQAPRTRGAPSGELPEVKVTPTSTGLTVTHDLSHACCLKSKISTQVSGDTVTVTEELSGTPCRCMCSSVVTTQVRLAPGDYTLRVVVDDRGQKKTATEQKLVVK